MRGVGKRLEPCLRQGLGEPARGAERHQGVAFAVDEQRRRAHVGDFGAQVNVAQPGEAGEQACCVGQRGVLERARELAADGARLRIALVEQGDEALQRCGRVGGNGGGETFEQCGRLCVGPAGGLYEGRRGADEDQSGEFFGGDSGRPQRQLRAERPGAQDGAGRQAVGQSLRGLREVGGGFGVAVAGQVERRDALLGMRGGQAFDDGRPGCTAGAPAVQQKEFSAFHASSRKASTRRSTCSVVCAAESETRRRALPCGTVGGRIPGTHRPRE